MKKSILLLSTLFLLTFNGCGGIQGLMIYDIDPTLQSINSVKSLPTQSSVGFEWEKTKDYRVQGVNIYRGNAQQGKHSLKRIGSVSNRYGTHFVDTHVKPDRSYIYTFTTYSIGKESRHGSIVKVRTPSAIKGVNFFKAYKVATGVIKLLWSPHTDKSINRYVIERSVNGGAWEYVAKVRGRLMVEYIDTFTRTGNQYKYRIFGKSYNRVLSKASETNTVSM